jgi:hypothetical protein
MDIEHLNRLSLLSRRSESHEQDGGKLMRAKLRSPSASSDPAMAFGLPLRDGRQSARPPVSAACSLPDEQRITLSAETRGQGRAQDAQRRIPSRSISDL